MAEGQVSYRTLDELIRGEVPGAQSAPPAELPSEPDPTPEPEPIAATEEPSRPPGHVIESLRRVLQDGPLRVADIIARLTETNAPVNPHTISARLTQFVASGYLTRTGRRGEYLYSIGTGPHHQAKVSVRKKRGTFRDSSLRQHQQDYARRAAKRLATMRRRYGTGSPAQAAKRGRPRKDQTPINAHPAAAAVPAAAPAVGTAETRTATYRQAVMLALKHNELSTLLREIGMGMLIAQFPAEWGLDR